ncbi:MAG TPA: hypothetical protein PKA66_01600 [Gemmatimonadales bacterium]|nr:hypothetical protein [Gemmatimonadales bacterium]
MRRLIGIAVLVLCSACAAEQPRAGGASTDSTAVAPVRDSTAPAPGAKESPMADSVMARDTARTM